MIGSLDDDAGAAAQGDDDDTEKTKIGESLEDPVGEPGNQVDPSNPGPGQEEKDSESDSNNVILEGIDSEPSRKFAIRKSPLLVNIQDKKRPINLESERTVELQRPKSSSEGLSSKAKSRKLLSNLLLIGVLGVICYQAFFEPPRKNPSNDL